MSEKKVIKSVIKSTDRWFPILARRGAVLLGWLESAGFGEKLLEFTGLNLTGYKEIRIVKGKEYTIFLEGITWAKTEEKFRKKLEIDKKYLNQIFKKFYPRLTKLEKFSKPRDLTKLSNSKLGELILTYADLYSDISPFYIVYNEVRPILKEKTENWLKKKVPQSKLQDYHITLATPLTPLYAVKEDRDLQRIIHTIKRDRKTRDLFGKNLNRILAEISDVSPQAFQMIKSHLESYYWVPVERDNPPWGIKDIISRIQYKLRQRERVFKKRENLKSRQKRYEKELKIPPKIMADFRGLRELMVAVDAMKRAYAISHCFLSIFLKVVAERLRVERDALYFLTPNEIATALKNKSQISKTEIKLRGNCLIIGCWIRGKSQVRIIKGNQVKSTIAKLIKPQKIKKEKVIKGRPASPGKVIGLVKVLKDATEVDKLSQGEILAAPMTTPDYIVAIHKAAAIVTDEGGVLCHAALVSREFGIPCVIGTKIVTKVLKDGDLVEVDAEKGIVKILEKRK